MAKTNQFGCGRPTGAADLKHANQWWGAKAKQLKPENCRPGNKQFGEEEEGAGAVLSQIFSLFFRYWGDHLHRRLHPACDNLH